VHWCCHPSMVPASLQGAMFCNPLAHSEVAFIRSTQDETISDQDLAGNDDIATGTSISSTSSALAKHAAKECRPCAWFYKPGGCRNGTECKHCHLCPEGELQARRNSKVALMRATNRDNNEQHRRQQWQDPLKHVQATRLKPLVDTQTTPQTSLNLLDLAADAGVIKSKILLESIPSTPRVLQPSPFLFSAAAVVRQVAADVPEPPPGISQLQGMLVSRGSVNHAAGTCKPCAWFYKPQGCMHGADCFYCHTCPEGEIKTRRKAKGLTLKAHARITCWADAESDDDDTSVTTASSQAEKIGPIPAADEVPAKWPMMQHASQKLPSLGSEYHSTGRCRPCTWFHRPGGCANGAHCNHCHICTVDEIRERRKAKVSAVKQLKRLAKQPAYAQSQFNEGLEFRVHAAIAGHPPAQADSFGCDVRVYSF